MAGTVDIMLRHYTGIDTAGTTIAFYPRLPRALKSLTFRVCYRDVWIDIEVTHRQLRLTVERDSENPIDVLVNGEIHRLRPGRARKFEL